MIKTKSSAPRRYGVVFLALACTALWPSAHAAPDISDTLVKTCTNQLNGSGYADAVLDEFRGTRFPSPKTGGFKITSVAPVLLAAPPYCLVKGTIQASAPAGVDPAVKAPGFQVPDINYQLYIPTQWNGKFVQLGGGGFAWKTDVVANGLQTNLQYSTLFQSATLSNYAVILSDAGVNDSSKGFDPDFVQAGKQLSDVPKQELVKNFGQDSIKKSLDVGLYLVKKLTKAAPSDTYFVGISTGGRQALKAIANWPDAYDGVVAGAPPVDETNLLKTLEVPAVVNDWVIGWSSSTGMLASLFGQEVSQQALNNALANVSQGLTHVAVESGATYDGYHRLLDALAPVWNVRPNDIVEFIDANARQTRLGQKGRKILIYQGTSDFLVPCTQAGAFVSQLSKLPASTKLTADGIRNSVRSFFIEDYSHGFYNTDSYSLFEAPRVLTPLQLNWDAVSALDRWVHDEKAALGAPLLARNPSGEIPGDAALKNWKCLAGS